MLRSFRRTLALLIPLLAAAPVSAAPSATMLKAQAMKLSAAGKHQAAAIRMSEARGALRRERRTASAGGRQPGQNPKYREAVRQLALKYRKQWEKGPRTAERRKTVYDAFTREKSALDRKFGVSSGGAGAGAAASQTRVAAEFDLRDAALEDMQAAYLEKAGDRRQAANLRRHALIQRTRALGVVGKRAEAEAAAARLLATKPRDPEAYRVAAELYQNHGKYADAARAWEQGIQALDAGSQLKSKQRSQILTLFYRQLAFSYQKTGRPNESRQALNRAQELERGR